MKLKKILGLSLIVISTFTSKVFAQSEIPDAHLIRFENVYFESTPYKDQKTQIKIWGTIKYGNECMSADQKFKKVTNEFNNIIYNVYSVDSLDKKVCPKIYNPVTETILIDTLIVKNRDIPSIIVNQNVLD